MQVLATKFIKGLGAICLGAAGYALLQQVVTSSTAQTLSHSDVSIEQALLIAEGAIEACKENDSVITVAVVDYSGGVRFLLRGDGASPQDVENARRKAYTARTFSRPTSEWMARTARDTVDADGNPLNLYGQRFLDNTIPEAGGIPIIWNGRPIGGVGVAGSRGGATNDEECARAGAAAIEDQLL